MLVTRAIAAHIKRLASQYPVITITGPRQSGKTTLCKMVFPEKAYVSLENPDSRRFAATDPNGFFKQYPAGAIIDEIQRVPELLSYIQGIVDDHGIAGEFIITGSAQFELLENVTQSLAGRTALGKLLPFSYDEIYSGQFVDVDEMLFKGFFPRIYDKKLDPLEAYAFYFETYIERDVRALINVKDFSLFERFVRLCAGRTGQVLNMSSLAADVGTSVHTIKSWLSVLEASFLVFFMSPHFRNYRKRLVKSPKMYFLDPGLACYLLGITQSNQLAIHPLRGFIFETYVICELLKQRFNNIKRSNLYFFRDNAGHEIDVIIDKGPTLLPIEIKSAATIHPEMFKGLDYYQKLNPDAEKPVLVYAGNESQQRSGHTIVSFNSIHHIDN
ncbi:MAG: ATP-binding protein [Deltaproteobacteria bacterium]|nr:ATP-binding protein [Deltaproteobacteria bacterium]